MKFKNLLSAHATSSKCSNWTSFIQCSAVGNQNRN